MAEGITVRPLSSLDDARAASELIDRIWGERRIMGAPLLWAMASHGGQVLGAWEGHRMVGAQAGLVGIVDGKPVLHSHITGVAEDAQHRGVGFALKVAQREWCLERGIDVVTWTFDPMVARNASFNLVKLGAVAVRFHRDYYGEMNDAFNRGERSDRLEVRWDLRSKQVKAAVKGVSDARSKSVVALSAVTDEDGWPKQAYPHPATTSKPSSLGPPERTPVGIQVPSDYQSLREKDVERARAWRDAVGEALEHFLSAGYTVTGFIAGQDAYLLERA